MSDDLSEDMLALSWPQSSFFLSSQDNLKKLEKKFSLVFMSSLCGVGVRVRMNNFFSKTTRPRDMLFFLKDTLSIEDEKLFKA